MRRKIELWVAVIISGFLMGCHGGVGWNKSCNDGQTVHVEPTSSERTLTYTKDVR